MLQLPIGPRFTISTTSAIPRGLKHYVALATLLGATGVDLDLTTWVSRRRPGVHVKSTADHAMPVSSIWLSAVDLDFSLRSLDQVTRGSENLGWNSSLALAVRLPGNTESQNDHHLIRSIHDGVRQRSRISDVTIVVPAAAPEGGRAHITRLRSLRRLTEEWGMTLGFDLSVLTDVHWEAEAAIQIAGPRLSLIRLRTRLPGVLSQANDVFARALVTCGDLGFSGTISLAPPTPFWLSWHAATVRRDLEHNRDTVARILTERRIIQRSFQTPLR